MPRRPRPPGIPRTDRQLVAGIARGEDAALAEFLDLHGGWALAVAQRFVPDPQLAEDALQESLIQLVERAPTLVVPESVRPWFYSVVRLRAMEQARQASRQDRIQTAVNRNVGPADSSAFAGEPAATTETDRAVREAVGRLPEILREVMILRVVDGLSVSQTALALDIPEGTVKSRLHAALASLRESPGLAGRLDPPGPDPDKKT